MKVLRLDDAPFAGRTGRGVSVAVIDSGVHAAHPHVGGVAGGVYVTPDGTLEDDFTDRLGHGTAVAAAIKEKAPGAEIWAIRVFGTRLSTTPSALIRAIEWAAGRDVTLINLSLGTAEEDHTEAMVAAVEHAAGRGALIVSPAEHDDAIWIPGSLPGVVGVELDRDCARDELRLAGDPLRLRASGYPRPIPGLSPELNLKGVSFAAANATGFLARALEAEPWPAVREALVAPSAPSLHSRASDRRRGNDV